MLGKRRLTFIFADVLECKRQTRVFSFDDADLAKGALADDAEQAEMVEAYCCPSMAVHTRQAPSWPTFIGEDDGLAAGIAHCWSSVGLPVKSTRCGGLTSLLGCSRSGMEKTESNAGVGHVSFVSGTTTIRYSAPKPCSVSSEKERLRVASRHAKPSQRPFWLPHN